jgi:AmmeMemoRadiSam system protein A
MNCSEPLDGYRLTSLARGAVEFYLREGSVVQFDGGTDDPLSLHRSACFVSIKTAGGGLRGCIGTLEPAFPTLAEETINNAISAATQDPRFPPVSESELPGLRFSVDVLSRPEPTSFADLDPAIYGVIVRDEAEGLCGLLLPDIQGIESPAHQVQIAARKGGIDLSRSIKLYRFTVLRFREPAN